MVTVLVVGSLAASALAMREAERFWIADALLLGLALSSLLEGIAKLVAYRRALPAW